MLNMRVKPPTNFCSYVDGSLVVIIEAGVFLFARIRYFSIVRSKSQLQFRVNFDGLLIRFGSALCFCVVILFEVVVIR